ncbi:MAG TPA: choice-of-anchor tandem repeat GloVer-containing protein [Candidatus Cybelea sp.]
MNIIKLLPCAAMLAACSQSGNSSAIPRTAALVRVDGASRSQPAAGGTFKLLYRWTGGPNGGGPFADLTSLNGALFGTTYAGWSPQYYGTVFKVTTSGDETVLYRFTGGKDGIRPFGGVTYLKGEFYGTTQQGGAHNCGIVFTITPSGTEHTLYSFKCANADGSYPRASLVNFNGTLYGTTYQGGANNLGTVFSITPSGTEKVLHSFRGGQDGEKPFARMVVLNGALYGTASAGGGPAGGGAVFKITPAGAETIIHRFAGAGDGAEPQARLLVVRGVLYGTTRKGGTNNKGSVFAISLPGQEKVIFSFNGTDGAAPDAGLVFAKGVLFGTTAFGAPGNYGVVYKLTKTGTQTVLYAFKGQLQGFGPVAGLTVVNGVLYGNTTWGGQKEDDYSCCGIVYSVSP